MTTFLKLMWPAWEKETLQFFVNVASLGEGDYISKSIWPARNRETAFLSQRDQPGRGRLHLVAR